MGDNWYLARDRKKQGPFSLAQMQQMARAGQLLPTDMVLQEGTQRWLPASQVEEFFPRPQAAPPPTPIPVAEATYDGLTRQNLDLIIRSTYK